jgi:hypothetical protein
MPTVTQMKLRFTLDSEKFRAQYVVGLQCAEQRVQVHRAGSDEIGRHGQFGAGVKRHALLHPGNAFSSGEIKSI